MASRGQAELTLKVSPVMDRGKLKAEASLVEQTLKSAAADSTLYDSTRTNAALASTQKQARETAAGFDHLEAEARQAAAAASGSLGAAGGQLRNAQGQFVSGAASLKGLPGELKAVGGGFDEAAGKGGKFGNVLGGMGGLVKGAGLAGLAVGLAGVGKQMISSNAEMERYTTQLGVLIGDAGKTNKLLDELKIFGAQTPFEFPELAEASRNLIAFGFSAGETVPELKKVGDISSAVGANIGEIAEIYGKARVQGTLYAEDINQLVGRGIPVIQEFAKQLNVSEAEVKKLASEGKIGFPQLQKAFTDLTSEGGKFHGMMEAQSKTFEGLVSTFKDNIGGILRDLGGPLFDAVKGGLTQIMTIVQSDTVQKAVGSVGKALGSVLTVLMGVLEKVLPAVTSLLGPIGDTVVTLLEPIGALVSAVLGPVSDMIQQVAGPVGQLLTTLASIVSGVLMPVIQAVSPILTSLTTIIGSVVSVVVGLLNAILPVISLALQPLILVIQVLAAVLQAVLEPIADVVSMFAEFTQQLLKELQPAIDEGVKLFKEIATLIGGVLVSAIRGVIGFFQGMAREIGNVVLKMTGATSASDLFQKILGFVKGAVEKVSAGLRILRGVVEGVKQAFDVVRTTMKAFVDAILSLDVKAAIKAFAGFGDKIASAYKKGFESVVNDPAAQVAKTEEAARTTTEEEAKKTQATTKKKGEDLKKLREDLNREIEAAASKSRVAAIEDARKRELKALDESFQAEQTATKEKYKKLGEGNADVVRLLGIQLEQYTREREDLTKKLVEQGLKTEADAFKNARQQELELIRANAELIQGEDERAIRKRTAARVDELEKQQELELGLLARQTEQFKTKFAELDRDLLADKISAEKYREGIEGLVANALTTAAEGSEIALASRRFAAKINETLRDGNAAAQDAWYKELEEKIRNRTTDLAALDNKLRLLELRKGYAADLRAAGENDALKAQAHRRFLSAQYDLELSYLAQRNDAVQAALSVEKGMRQAFLTSMDEKERGRLQDQVKRLETERDRLKQSFLDGKISHAEYSKELTRIYDERSKAQAQLEQDQVDFSLALAQGLVKSSANFEKQKLADVEASTTRLLEMSKAGQALTADFGKEQLSLLTDYGVQTLAKLTGAFGDMLAEGEINLKRLGNIVLSSLFDLVQKEITILTPAIYAKAFSMLGPILGAIAATAGLAVVQGGLALARSAAKFHTGGTDVGTDSGPRGTEFDATLLRGESVVTVEATRRERQLIDHLNDGGSALSFVLQRYQGQIADHDARAAIHRLDMRVADTGARLHMVTDSVQHISASLRRTEALTQGVLASLARGAAPDRPPVQAELMARTDRHLRESVIDRFAPMIDARIAEDAHLRGMADATRETAAGVNELGKKMDKVAEGQEKVAARFSHATALDVSFSDAVIDGDTIRMNVNNAKARDLSAK